MSRRIARDLTPCLAGLLLLFVCASAQAVVVVATEAGQQQQNFDGFSVRKEAGKFNDALEDFERYRDKKAWELAFRSLDTLAEAKREGMVPAGGGFFIPSRQRILRSLTALPPDGKQAFRIFYDAKARQLLERVEATSNDAADGGKPVDEIATLREIFDRYFISSVGDRAADRLGDALFEQGDFASAASVWGAILRDAPDSSIPPVRLQVKRCTALARAGQWDTFDEALRRIRSEFAGEQLTIGGQKVSAVEHLESLRQSATTRPTTGPAQPWSPDTLAGPVQLPADDKPAWQIKLVDETLGRKLEQALGNNNWGAQFSTLRRAVPDSATDGKKLYVNWLGVVFAADLASGKLVWRNRKFSELGDKFQNFVNMLADTESYTLTVGGTDRLFVTGINLDRLNHHQEPVRLVCMSAVDGKVKWSSTSGAVANWSFVGRPAPAGDVVFATARPRNSMDLSLLAIGAEKGDLQWQVLLGTAKAGSNYRGETEMPKPVIVPTAGTLYVLTNNGAVVAVDTVARQLRWAFTYEPPPIQNRQMFWSGGRMQIRPKMSAAAILEGSSLYIKEEGGAAVYALDLSTPALLWQRPLDRESSIVPLGNGRLLSIGQDLAAIDATSSARSMLWSAPLPSLLAKVDPLVGENRVLAFVSRGIYEIDLSDGDTVRIFRGADRDSIGGTLQRVPGRLVAVSNLTVTAYPTADATEQAAGR